MAIGQHEVAGVRGGREALLALLAFVRPSPWASPYSRFPDRPPVDQQGAPEASGTTRRHGAGRRPGRSGRVRHWASIADENDGSDPLKPRRDDVASKAMKTDVAVLPHILHPVVMGVGDQETAPVGLHGEGESAGNGESECRRGFSSAQV